MRSIKKAIGGVHDLLFYLVSKGEKNQNWEFGGEANNGDVRQRAPTHKKKMWESGKNSFLRGPTNQKGDN